MTPSPLLFSLSAALLLTAALAHGKPLNSPEVYVLGGDTIAVHAKTF